ncbi:YhcN/YlaJ family sporulation lipoprotein [Hazenella sp. IB182357]|uniref:YhcN/YlaJ family sporulation lipoprotein n=1 Tax=Polycladospora coralii TaxID=2771432 RepID=A0A926N797_9BACL|nr:YhcN/YlaJ family sporulation lipoprotein [Polycladospora coralii]MBD1370867.1 YhcN/YlaJ family sporulation lipoprotein [Polycladospora coralii]MBS7529806.1 YhcN/YlaJ family sporulation lipoprotein [Polycladospora coralii]
MSYLSPFMTFLLIITMIACSPNTDSNMNQANSNDNVQSLYHDDQAPSRFNRTSNHDQMNGQENVNGSGQNQIGYFHYSPTNEVKGEAVAPKITIDRPLLARQIAQLITVHPDVKEATTLVTDDHVFIGIQPRNAQVATNATKEAIRTAESLTPRFYKINCTSDKELQSQIDSVGMRMRGSADVEGVRGDLEQLLREMGDESPPQLNRSLEPKGIIDINPKQK